MWFTNLVVSILALLMNLYLNATKDVGYPTPGSEWEAWNNLLVKENHMLPLFLLWVVISLIIFIKKKNVSVR